MKKIYVYGGGTFSHVRAHMSLAAPAFGETARQLAVMLTAELKRKNLEDYQVELVMTKMADSNSKLVTNSDVKAHLESVIADPNTRGVIFNVAMTDFDGVIGTTPSGKYADRLETANGLENMTLIPSEKVIGLIRKTRKDIFAVGFKTTNGKSSDEQYVKGLKLLKTNSLNLVLANDLSTRNNIVVAPEETRYGETTDRKSALDSLVTIFVSRMQNTFTRSTVVDGNPVGWDTPQVPESLREVVDHCIKNGAYKPFLGKTAGHFAVKVGDGEFLTSIRKTNFNKLNEVGLVKIQSSGDDRVIAYGARPSVGGQSQRIIFREHPDLDCIVHFHCPPKPDAVVPVASQWQNECGSHQCGKNTSDHLQEVNLGDGESLKVVYLDSHGPNIVFNRKTNPDKVIAFINQNFDLSAKTGGRVEV